MSASGLVEVAKVVAAHGIAGLLKVKAYAGPQTALTQCRDVYLASHNLSSLPATALLKVTVFRFQGDFCLMGFEGVDSRNQAELLKGAVISIKRSDFPSLAAGEYYWADLIGCQVVNREGVNFGPVQSVESFGAHPLLKVAVPGQRFRLIPFVTKHVEHVDIDEKKIVVDWHVDDFAD